jgi:hypothetical protein
VEWAQKPGKPGTPSAPCVVRTVGQLRSRSLQLLGWWYPLLISPASVPSPQHCFKYVSAWLSLRAQTLKHKTLTDTQLHLCPIFRITFKECGANAMWRVSGSLQVDVQCRELDFLWNS